MYHRTITKILVALIAASRVFSLLLNRPIHIKRSSVQKFRFDSKYIASVPSRVKLYDSQEEEQEQDIPDVDMLLASPLSQVFPEYETGVLRSFPRGDQWLEKATEDMLDEQQYPLGQLSEEDVESIAGLMAAWARRKSLEAALVVEKLLKRVVDDMRAGNTGIQVTTRLYTIAIDAWAKSGAEGSAHRAHIIHDGMVHMYKETGDPLIAPSSISYNTLMNAWGKSFDPDSPVMAEKILAELIEAMNSGQEELKPDAITFSTMMEVYARSDDPNAAKRAEELFCMMDDLGVQRNVFTFSALQNVYARSGRPDAAQKAQAILSRMLELYNNGDVFAKPNCINYNAVLNALTRAYTHEAAERAHELLEKMELPVSEGGFDVSPDRLSYALAILACTRSPDEVYAADKSEENLRKMETRAALEAQKREEISSAAPPAVTLDLESFNVCLTAISRSRQTDSVPRAISIIRRMENYAKEGKLHIRPNIRSWNAVLNTLSRSCERGAHRRSRETNDAPRKAEQILNHLYDLHRSGVPNVKPDAFSFAAVLSAYQKSSKPGSAQRADDILRRMEELYEQGEIESHPDVFHYTIVCAAWARSRKKAASGRVLQILMHMKERDEAGYPNVRPNVRTYNAVLDCLSRGREEDKAEQLLYFMLNARSQGDDDASPDSFSFNSVITGFTRSRRKGSGRRAEAILERFLEYHQGENPLVRPDTRSFTHIIGYYGRLREPDAPYRAEYLLNRMVSMFKSGYHDLAPNVFAVTTVMDAYSYAKHPDAGESAERLLKLAIELKNDYGASNLEINSSVMNSVLFAWASSGDENAGRRAEVHLRNMELKYEAGVVELCPSTRSYGLVLNAWSKSNSFDKANRALEVLRRMEAQHRRGNPSVRPNEHAYSLVVNACAFTNSGGETEQQAFDIAVTIFDEMMKSDLTRPSSLTYGWFIQACGRLKVSEQQKISNIERAFMLCCEDGLVNEFVLQRLKGAAPDLLYKQLMTPVLSTMGKRQDSSERLKQRVHLSQIPRAWKRNCSNRRSLDSRGPWWEASHD